jgi:hypothetical protein
MVWYLMKHREGFIFTFYCTFRVFRPPLPPTVFQDAYPRMHIERPDLNYVGCLHSCVMGGRNGVCSVALCELLHR